MDSSTYLPIARIDEPEEDAPAHVAGVGIDHGLIRLGEQRHHAADGPAPHARTGAELV